jgi:nucleotide-binding universal stress UspA family protein
MAKIVVGVDGSSGALQALRWALAEARLRGASVHVVYAWMLPLSLSVPTLETFGVPDPGPPMEDVYEKLRARAEADLAASLQATGVEDVELTGEAIEGRAVHVLLEAARDADLLVVGSRGRGGFAGLLLGSVSQQCAHHAPCPIVIVPMSEQT